MIISVENSSCYFFVETIIHTKLVIYIIFFKKAILLLGKDALN